MSMLIFTLPAYMVLGMVILAAAAGYAIRGSERLRLRKRVYEMETESLATNAHLLELEREILEMETRLTEAKIPVIPLAADKPGKPSLRQISPRKQIPPAGTKPRRHSASR